MFFIDDDNVSLVSSALHENCSLLHDSDVEVEDANANAVNETSPKERAIQKFCEQVEDTLKHNMKGYASADQLACHIFEDHQIDAHRLAKHFAFSSFVDFLHSPQMKDYIDILDGGNDDNYYGTPITYHYPFVKEKQYEPKEGNNSSNTSVHQQIQESFLDLHQSSKIFQRHNRGGHNPNLDSSVNEERLLRNRWYKRRGLVDPEETKLHPPPLVAATPESHEARKNFFRRLRLLP